MATGVEISPETGMFMGTGDLGTSMGTGVGISPETGMHMGTGDLGTNI